MISVIVPVYNAEKYLYQCVDSILNQSFVDIELLLINDGSNDNSMAICNEYAQSDSRVRVLEKDNGGVASARNLGLDYAKGEWITFIDADDWVAPSFLGDVYEKAIDGTADIIFVDIKYKWPNYEDIYHTYRWHGTPQDALIDYLTQTRNCPGWGLVRSSLIKDNHFRFPENITIYEDFHLLVRLVYKSKTILNVEKPLYNYRMQGSSIVHSIDQNRMIHNQTWAYNSILQFFKENGEYHKYASALYARILHDYQRMVLDSSQHVKFLNIYPDKKHYIWQSTTINLKLKIMMWCLTHNMSWLTYIVVKVRDIFIATTNNSNIFYRDRTVF